MAVAGLNILVLNAGSSTVKASLFQLTSPVTDVPTGRRWEVETREPLQSLDAMLAGLWTGPAAILDGPDEVDVIGHRVVYGGATLVESVRLAADTRAEIARVAEYAPAHNAAAIALIDAARNLFGDRRPQVAVFDTTFHRTMPPAAFTYAGPYAWLAQGIRRYGFHGISHQYASHRAARLLRREDAGFRVVTCHLGSGCSLAAVRDGLSVDTTMGFTPMDGLPMATRSGAIDPGILIHLLRHRGHTAESLDHMLNHDAGLAGLSGTNGDMRVVLAGVDAGDDRARLAFDVFVHHVRQGIAAMVTTMNGTDAVVFTGGIGAHSARVRTAVCASLTCLGISLDVRHNAEPLDESDISTAEAPTRVLVIPAQENWMIARECVRMTESGAG